MVLLEPIPATVGWRQRTSWTSFQYMALLHTVRVCTLSLSSFQSNSITNDIIKGNSTLTSCNSNPQSEMISVSEWLLSVKDEKHIKRAENDDAECLGKLHSFKCEIVFYLTFILTRRIILQPKTNKKTKKNTY